MTSSAAASTISSFKAAVAEEQLADLRLRLKYTRWPEAETAPGWMQGVPLHKARELVEYWRESYDWRRFEHRLNSFPQFRTEIDGLGIHFIHARSRHAHALPLLLTHGWPGSVVEFLRLIGPLTDPTAHGWAAIAGRTLCPQIWPKPPST